MDTTYSHTIRALLCPHCGAPLSAPTAGARISCRYCRVELAIGARDERPLQHAPSAPLPEPERLARLRAQVGRPLAPPPLVAELLHEGTLAPWKHQEAAALWQSTRAELASGPRPEAAERLFFLTLLLFSAERDPARKRALLETALDLLTLPRHRQALRCMLARNAVLAGDLVAARAWLAPCDARSDDLASDTEHRFALAYVATAERRWDAVLAAIGARPHDVPLAASAATVCAVLRANAHERQGAVATAAEQLSAELRAGLEAPRRIEAILEANRALDLCPQSLSRARAAATAATRADPAQTTLFVLGAVFLTLGLPLLAAGAAMLVLLATGGADRITAEPIVLPMGGILTILGGAHLRRALLTRRLRLHGIEAQAEILRVEMTRAQIG
ncbi:uncharacterized protein SOCEGT47_002450 [Sorangium cellulosum]|uniref:Uncharacterized protein n=1 Tax=Sorangium cellulosum TaxID=56 RepID=A0A4V0NCN5_SORCE|nr:hypothetical protein [Sorangium cellulosum]AUX19792.1 uncharacterized protein SOCEGT47_002450 [Sorangium cellulosum]